MTHERVECRLFPEAIPITRHGAGYSILTCAHSPISHFRALFSAFQGFPDFPSKKLETPREATKTQNPLPPPNPRGVKGYEEIRCHWIGIGLGRYTLQIFFWELSLFFLSCIVTVIYAFLLGELTALPIQRKCS